MLATLSETGEFNLQVRRAWRSIVEPRDLDYMELLCRDLKESIHSDPVALFKQLSFLAVGALVTRATGTTSPDDPSFGSSIEGFVII